MTKRGFFLYFLVLYQIHYAISLESCSLSSGLNQYDLSALISDVAYSATGDGGEAIYYFGFCTAVSQGACLPGQAVCQVGDASHGCGAANYVTLEEMKGDKEGVIVHYNGGDKGRCSEPRKTTINVFCDVNVTHLEVIGAAETSPCVYQINVASRYGCKIGSDLSSNIPVNIFVAVHSHDDVGWTSTVKQYYDLKVNKIISNIVTALNGDKDRKFIQVEMAFFKKWWDQQNNETRSNVHKLVSSSQLSFVMGGWVMPDEANPTYGSLINQLTDGHQFLLQEFNYTPSVGWQIDPFGASTVVAEIYKNSTFKGHVIDRIKHRQKNDMLVNKSLQFSWKLSSNNNESMLTHMLDTNYCYPYMSDFKFEYALSDALIEKRAYTLVQIARDKARWNRTPNVFIPMGCDFSYDTNAKEQYEALDLIFKCIKENAARWNVTGIQYSNVADYFDAIAKYQHLLPTYQGDFFPYNDKDNSWWTGYFTSRPEKKGLIRDSEALLRTTETLYSFAHIHKSYNNSDDMTNINGLSHVIGVNLHHDAITGTEKQDVNDDYVKLLNNERIPNQEIIKTTLFNLTDGAVPSFISNNIIDLRALNDNTGNPDDTTIIPLVIYNSLSWTRHDYVKINMTNYNNTYDYKVSCEGQVTASQIIEDFEDFKVDGVVVLFFKVILPPMGYKTYYVHTYDSTVATPAPTTEPTPTPTPTPASELKGKRGDPEPEPVVPAPEVDELITLSNKHFKVMFSSNNTIESVNTSAINFTFQQKFMAYDSYNGNDGHPSSQQSGAYIFRPDGPARYLDNRTSFAKVLPHIGNFVSDVYQMFEAEDKDAASFVKQHVRIFHDDDEYLGNFIELSQSVSVPEQGKEIITRFMSSIVNNNISFTDSNGLRFLKRSYNANEMLPIPANYYPTVYASYIQDDNNAIGFIFDRAHGISSSFGNVEVMLHRRTLRDDNRGVVDVLNDITTVHPVMRVVFGTKKGIMKLIYRHIYLLNFPPVVTIGAPTNQTNQTTNNTLSLLEEMPQNVHVLDLKPIGADHLYLLRLAHLFDYAEHALFSSPVKFYARSLFKAPFCISSIQETSLTANSVINEHKGFFLEKNYSVILQPKQIKTFLVNITKDFDFCAENSNVCGEQGTCMNIPCGHWCDCEFNYEYKLNEGCIYKGQQSTGPILYLAQQLPLVVMAYLVVVCTYSMRSELRKMTESSSPYSSSSSSPISSSSSSPSSSSSTTRKRRRKSQEPTGSGLSYRLKVFMHANKRLLERTFFPQNLQSNHND